LLARERDLRQQAEQADRLKDEFLATLSHELRTPLTSILGWATLIRNGDVDRAENLERALEIIERNARSQARLIDDLLDVSRIITGHLQLEVHPLNLEPIVEVAIEALRPAASAKGIQIVTTLDPRGCLVTGDPNRLRQVIWNLLMNAIKFTPRGGRVSLRLDCLAPSPSPSPDRPFSAPQQLSFVRLTISDTGDGITPEFLPYVFHRFRQEEGSISRKAGGLGLGLAVVRHLVELHGGSVSAESPGPGMGSTFIVDLPLATERRDSRVAETEAEQSAFNRRSGDRNRTNGEFPGDGVGWKDGSSADSDSESVIDSPALAGVRVLLVEDDDDSRSLLSLVLERYGAEVVATASSAAAIDSFMQKTPDVVVSDIGMAEEDGYQLIRKLRSLPQQGSLLQSSSDTRHPALVPAIALTGYATHKDRERALAAGYQLHLAKPVEADSLVAAILKLIRRG